MKRLIFILVSISVLAICSFIIIKTVNRNSINECLDYRYPNESFAIESVGLDFRTKEMVARIRDTEGIEATIRKRDGTVYSDYEVNKAKSLIENELTKVLHESELLDYIDTMDIKVLERIEYSDFADGLNPVTYLTIAYNDKISSKKDFAQMSHDVIRTISKAKYNNVGTYVFDAQTTEDGVINLVVYEDGEVDFDTLLSKVIVVEEIRIK